MVNAIKSLIDPRKKRRDIC